MRRLSAIVMLLGAATAALGVAAVVGIERIDLPPAAVRAIADALPVVVLVSGLALLLLGTFMARIAKRDTARGATSVGATAGLPSLDAGAPSDLAKPPAPGAPVARSAASKRTT
jgi:hypothetical protein